MTKSQLGKAVPILMLFIGIFIMANPLNYSFPIPSLYTFIGGFAIFMIGLLEFLKNQ